MYEVLEVVAGTATALERKLNRLVMEQRVKIVSVIPVDERYWIVVQYPDN